MAATDSGSDGENGEKPVRERLKQTTIDKTSADTSQVDDEGDMITLAKPSIQVESKDGDKERSRGERKDTVSKRGNESAENDPAHESLRKRAKEDTSDLPKPLEENGSHDMARTASPARGGASPERAARPAHLDDTLTSPRRKRSRESFGVDEDMREQKIPSTEETRARRSSSEERRTRAELQGTSRATSADGKPTESTQPIFGATLKPKPMEKPEEKPQTSSAAFAASGFASLSGNASPFGTLGSSSASASKSPEPQPAVSSFASAKQQPNTFGSSFANAPSSFASASKMSGFGSLGGSAFGGGISAFGGGSGPKLTSFAASAGNTILGNKKEEKPFGAPADSEEESGGESESSEEAVGEDAAPKQVDSPTAKFHVQEVHTGEDNEKSIFVNRAKLFQFHPDTSAWKERGVGPIKVNVEQPAIDTTGGDSTGEASRTTYSKSRLLMRNHATHKVILNAHIFKEMTISEQTSKQLTFVCPNESGKMTTYLLRMSKEDDIKQLHQTVKDIQEKM